MPPIAIQYQFKVLESTHNVYLNWHGLAQTIFHWQVLEQFGYIWLFEVSLFKNTIYHGSKRTYNGRQHMKGHRQEYMIAN